MYISQAVAYFTPKHKCGYFAKVVLAISLVAISIAEVFTR